MNLAGRIYSTYRGGGEVVSGLPLRASEIGRCTWATWARLTGQPAPPHSPRVQMLMDDGLTHEELIVARLIAGGVPVRGRQMRVERGPVVGHIDGVVEVEGEERLLEVKAVSRFFFPKLIREGVGCTRPHRLQVQGYMDMSGLPRAHYIAKCKDTAALYEELVERDQAVVAEFWTRVGLLSQMLGPPVPDPEPWECTECRWRMLCPGRAEEKSVYTGVVVRLSPTQAPELAEAAALWRTAHVQMKQVEPDEEAAREVFRGWLEQHQAQAVEITGVKAAYSERSYLDSRLVREKVPLVAKEATKVSKVLKITEVEKVG